MKSISEKIVTTAILIRRVEERIALEYKNQEIRCPVHLSIGQEYASSIFSAVVKEGDKIVSTHRSHAHYLASNGNLDRMIAEIYGKSTGCSKGRGGSMHLTDTSVGFLGSSAIVGNSIPIGVGVGLSNKLRENGAVSFVFLGDGAIEEGVFYESANFAALANIPVVFICENNFYSVYTSLESRQPKSRNLVDLVEKIGVKSEKINSNEFLDSYNKLDKLVDISRRKSLPIFIEFETYRFIEHCGPNNDDYLNYRPLSEIDHWKKRDPLLTLKSFASNNSISEERFLEIENIIENKINMAFAKAKSDPFPTFAESIVDVYAK